MSSLESDSYNQRIQSPNFTQIPNVVFDYWMNHLSHAEFKVLCAICRKTFGWHKTQDYISIKQIENLTLVSRRSVQECIHVLEKHGLIEIIKSKNSLGGDAPNLYRINVIEDIAPPCAKIAPPHAEVGGSATIAQGVAQPLHPQKKPIQKKEEIERKAFGKFVRLSEEEYNSLCRKEPKEKVDEIIQEINDHCTNNRPGGYDDYSAAFRTFLRNKNKTQGSMYGNRTKNKRKSQIGEAQNPTGVFINGVRIE